MPPVIGRVARGGGGGREKREKMWEREPERKAMDLFFQKLMKSMPACILNVLCPLEAEDHN